MLAFEVSKTIIEGEFRGLGLAKLACGLVVEARRRGGVDGRVDEHGIASNVTPSRDLSEGEFSGFSCEGWVTLAGRRSGLK